MKDNYLSHASSTKRASDKWNLSENTRSGLPTEINVCFRNHLLYILSIITCLSCNHTVKQVNESERKFKLHKHIETFNLNRYNNRHSEINFQKMESKPRLLADENVINLTPDDISLLGTGFNSVTGELLAPQVITSSATSTDENGGIQRQVINANMATSYDELLSSMDVSGGVSLGIKVFSASAKMETIHTIHTSSSSTYLVYHTIIDGFSRELTTPTLSNDSDVMRKLRNYNRFFGFAGDEYVYRETFGGELYIIFAAEAYNSSEYSENKKSFSAATSFINLGGSANIDNAMTKIRATSNMQMYVYQKGGEGFSSTSDAATVTEMFKYAQNFAKQVKDHATLVSFDTKQYQTARGFPSDYQGYAPIRAYKIYMNSIINKLLKINYLSGNVAFTARNSNLFKTGFADSIALFNAPLNRQIDKLQHCANQCRSDYSPLNCSQCDALHYDSVRYNLILPASAPPANTVASAKAGAQ